MKKVGKSLVEETGKVLSYRTVKMDIDGWVNAKEYLPDDYDIMYLKIKDRQSTHGWISGNKWDGLRIRPDDEVLYWKRKQEAAD